MSNLSQWARDEAAKLRNGKTVGDSLPDKLEEMADALEGNWQAAKSATIPHGRMKIRTARKRWIEVRDAATSGDPDRMFTAVSKFETIAEMAMNTWARASLMHPQR